MNDFDIKYEILDYAKYNKRLLDICSNPNNKFQVIKQQDLGKSRCGFPIEHYTIGNGPKHIVYMGGAHGNEIISVDFVTQLMNNIALGKGTFEDFDTNEFTIDFIPCQNPEGYFTTTYALNSVMKDMSPQEIEAFSKRYYLAYKSDDINSMAVNACIRTVCNENGLSELSSKLIKLFWKTYLNKDFSLRDVEDFLIANTKINGMTVSETVRNVWQQRKLDSDLVIPKDKMHHKIFDNISIDCIPEIDDAHIKLKESLRKLYANNDFPIATLANFFSNSAGVNLNDNNEFYFEAQKRQVAEEGIVYANLRDNNLAKSIPGPVGSASVDLNGEFVSEPENEALYEFLARQDESSENYAFINCHGTGGVIYLYPVADDDLKQAHDTGVERNFSFYINNRIATEYVKETGRAYEEVKGVNDPYKHMGYPDKITGVGDVLRKKYIASFLLELSKAGGNPIAPYCDYKGNYVPTMVANMRACSKMMQTIRSLSYLYDTNYTMHYENGRVVYGTTSRR